MKNKFLNLLLYLFLLVVSLQSHLKASQPEHKKQPDLKDTLKANQLYDQSFNALLYGQFDSALYYINQSIAISSELNYKKGLIRGITNTGNIYNFKGDFKQANTNYFLALELVGDTNSRMVSAIYNGIASVYYVTDNYSEALNYHFKAIRVAEKYKDSIAIYSGYTNLGQVYTAQKQYELAINKYNQVLSFFKAKQDTSRIGNVLYNLGHVYVKQQKRKEAVICFEEALRLAKAKNNPRDEALAYIGMYALLPEHPDFEKAFSDMNRTLEIEQEIGDMFAISSCLEILGKLSLAQKNYPKAIDYLNRSREISAELEALSEVGSADDFLSEAYEATGNYKEALRHYKDYIIARDSIFNEANTKKTIQAELNYEFGKKQIELKKEQEKKDSIAKEVQKKQQLIIWTISSLSILLIIIAFLAVRQVRFKNREREMQLEQKLLRSQMNPHFIFNSLQSIQNFILKHKEKDAVKYLGSFAAITRSVLENSRLESIPLRKELDLLENYLQLQKLRFEGEFEYVITVDEAIDVEETYIPPMLAQPFIENALEHGISGGNQGLIQISFHLKKNHLLMEVKDNGKGMESKRESAQPHNSLALVITKERIELMNKKNKYPVLFSINEAYPEKERKGVRVNFDIPLGAIS